MSKLVIVESPAKAKNIKGYLGRGYDVIASMGHVRDLPSHRLSVDIDNDFEPRYSIIKGKENFVTELKKKAEASDYVYLATDPDREGEAISWHLATILGLDMKEKNRVTFNEITKHGVTVGMENPRQIDTDLVDAQQARRILDRLIGYKLSPFISQKIRKGLSAGRVQSVALRIIVDREEEIRAFVPEEYWSIDAKFTNPPSRKVFSAAIYSKDGEKLKITDKKQSDRILSELENAEYTVSSVKKGSRKKSPTPPFITSTLQQEASRRLSFQGRRTMRAAQELYEGVSVGELGTVGLITYMRTDSLRISEEARAMGNDYIVKTYGEKYLPKKPRYYKSRSNVQDGHEAIRPTMPNVTPDSVKAYLSADQYKIYKLVWERFIASLMESCLQETMRIEIDANGYIFVATGYTVKFDGFTALYEEKNDDDGQDGAAALPPIAKGDVLKLKSILGNQHFTQPPARYTEASLIKALEENGVGRPSTYVTITSTILDREYVKREGKQFVPTELGEVVTNLLKERIPNIVNIKYTSKMEEDLDKIDSGEKDYKEMIRLYYDDFEKPLEKAKDAMKGVKIKLSEDETDVICEKCGR
ncbi:MAG: type I DNA topoisomerase, partial [Eubacterium sp.]|nr:type I DNA topoisomerase [Eubacterium sp.]